MNTQFNELLITEISAWESSSLWEYVELIELSM